MALQPALVAQGGLKLDDEVLFNLDHSTILAVDAASEQNLAYKMASDLRCIFYE